MPVSEYPFDGSWGYQPIGLYAPTSRFGTPADFQGFVPRCHQDGPGVLLDWVPGHSPADAHRPAWFAGTHPSAHADPRPGDRTSVASGKRGSFSDSLGGARLHT